MTLAKAHLLSMAEELAARTATKASAIEVAHGAQALSGDLLANGRCRSDLGLINSVTFGPSATSRGKCPCGLLRGWAAKSLRTRQTPIGGAANFAAVGMVLIVATPPPGMAQPSVARIRAPAR